LIGPDTINTMPQETLNAYRDHGQPEPHLEDKAAEAQELLHQLDKLDINLSGVTQQLEDEGIEKFNQPFDRLLETLKKERAAVLTEPVDRQSFDLGEYAPAVERRIDQLEQTDFNPRLWRKDPSLWSTYPDVQEVIRNTLGWLHVAERMEDHVDELADFAAEIRVAGLRHVVHLGMGGSSLAPLVFQRTFAPGDPGLPLTILDTTDPETILNLEYSIPLENTLFIVASKSGTTAETRALADYFYRKVTKHKPHRAGDNFVAITDPDTPLAALAQKRGFRHVFTNFPDIGGRYSALSYFGLVPAALLGLDVGELLARAQRMLQACASCISGRDNPGLALGATMGELAHHGRDKVTFLVPESMATFGMWLEQLLAESTGKDGAGLLPVAGESIGNPSVYVDDRLFVYFRLTGEIDLEFDHQVERLRQAGHPVVTIQMDDRLDVGQEFFRWEMAVAVAGSILDINPFDQPNVQESKDNTNRLLQMVKDQRKLPQSEPTLTEAGLAVDALETAPTLVETLARFLSWAHQSEFVALMAYLPETPKIEEALQNIRLQLRDHLHVTTTLGYGPRFLHSTGQYHKGGANIGLFLQLTADDDVDIQVPDQPYSFSIFKQAQAMGDLEALRQHARRVIHIHLRDNVEQGLATLQQILESVVLREAAEMALVDIYA
jgi:transaldolase/glucose-6-phosphate isomerase